MGLKNTASLLAFYRIQRPEKIWEDDKFYLRFLLILPEKPTHMERHPKQMGIANNLGSSLIDVLSRFQRLSSVVVCDSLRVASQMHDEHKAMLMARWEEAAEKHKIVVYCSTVELVCSDKFEDRFTVSPY